MANAPATPGGGGVGKTPLNTEDCRHLLAAQGYVELGMTAAAAEEAAAIPRRHQGLPEVLAVRVDICRGLGDWEEMAKLARQLVTLQPQQAQWFISWAYAARRTGSLQQARSILLQGQRLHLEEPIIAFNLACYAAQLGELDRAREHLAQAIKLDPKCRLLARDEPDLEPIR